MATGRIQDLLIVQLDIAAGSAGVLNYTTTRGMKFVDCSLYATNAGAGTILLTDSIAPITDAMNPGGVDLTVVRPTTIDPARTTFTAGQALQADSSGAALSATINCHFIPPNNATTTQTLV
jgi:hypothetical protein